MVMNIRTGTRIDKRTVRKRKGCGKGRGENSETTRRMGLRKGYVEREVDSGHPRHKKRMMGREGKWTPRFNNIRTGRKEDH